ncbi:MAG TPA: DsbA family oxidoreductase [Stellaceae bacterium]|nr:DsbA family oxidoreductase [Stellaceae bacterium]
MHIDIVSDVICPWCFIGKRRLEKALSLRPDVAAEITWRPFQLNPDMPAEGMERKAYIAAKFGGGGQADRIYANVAEVGATIGIPFAFDRIRRTPNTRDAHRLIRWAAAQTRAHAVVEGLFRAYFLDGRDIGDRAVLAEIAGAAAGLDVTEARQWLDGKSDIEPVLAEDRGARRLGINAVPCFIFERHYAVSGAQEPEFFLPIFDLVQNGAEATS